LIDPSGAGLAQLADRDVQRAGGVLEVAKIVLEQLAGDQRDPGVAPGLLVAVGAGELAAQHVGGIEAHVDHERPLGIADRPGCEPGTQNSPRTVAAATVRPR